MKIILDAYRGGDDTGVTIGSSTEKEELLKASHYLKNLLKKENIDVVEIRQEDTSLTNEERVNKINQIKNDNDLIIELRYNKDNNIEIIYPLRNTDNLASQISKNLESNNIPVDKYYSQRLPSNPSEDYYYLIRKTSPNETLIIYLSDLENKEKVLDIISSSIISYINSKTTYTIKKGDTLYSIAKKYNTTATDIKKLNNLYTNNLKIGSIIKITEKNQSKNTSEIENQNATTDIIYTIKKGDTLYKIASIYSITPNDIIKANNLKNTNLTIGNTLIIPKKETYINYKIKSGDTLYNIAKKYNTTVDIIKKINNLKNNNLTIGVNLKIPQ